MTSTGQTQTRLGASEIKEIMRSERWHGNNAKAYQRYRVLSLRNRWAELLSHELANIDRNEEILEVGAGTGYITEVLAKSGFRVCGMDLSADMLAFARQNLEEAGLAQNVRLQVGDAEALDAPDNGFAAVVSRWVLWTLPQPQKALSEMVRVVAPGGKVVVVDGHMLQVSKLADLRASFVDMVVGGRLPGWKRPCYARINTGLPRLGAADVAQELRALGLTEVTHRDLSPRETDGRLRFWLTGSSWQSHMVTGVKPR